MNFGNLPDSTIFQETDGRGDFFIKVANLPRGDAYNISANLIQYVGHTKNVFPNHNVTIEIKAFDGQ